MSLRAQRDGKRPTDNNLKFDIRTPVLTATVQQTSTGTSAAVASPSTNFRSTLDQMAAFPSPSFPAPSPDISAFFRRSPRLASKKLKQGTAAFSPRMFWRSPVSLKRRGSSIPSLDDNPLEMPPAYFSSIDDDGFLGVPPNLSLLRTTDLDTPVLPTSDLDFGIAGVKRLNSEVMNLVDTDHQSPKRRKEFCDSHFLSSDSLCLADYEHDGFEALSEDVKISMTHTGSKPTSCGTSPVRVTAAKMPRVRSSNETTSAGNGSSCHQCKSRRTHDCLSYCCNSTKTKGVRSRRPCRKKYCHTCLNKFYHENPPAEDIMWLCPACRKMCCCAACRRHAKGPSKGSKNGEMSPATSIALGIVYFGDKFDASNFSLDKISPEVAKAARKGAKKIVKNYSRSLLH